MLTSRRSLQFSSGRRASELLASFGGDKGPFDVTIYQYAATNAELQAASSQVAGAKKVPSFAT